MKRKYFLVMAIIFLMTSCDKQDQARQYTEVVDQKVTTSAAWDKTAADPHAGMNMPLGASGMPGEDPHAFMKGSGGQDPHAGYTKEKLEQMLKEMVPSQEGTMSAPIVWTVPAGWMEKPAEGMRLATFVNKNKAEAIDCSIVTLGGGAGGLEPNVIRWLGQLHIDTPPANEMKQFIEKAEQIELGNNLRATVFDFTQLQNKTDAKADSMIAAIIDTPQQRVFVKMTGTKQNVTENLKPYQQLIKSLKFTM